MVYRKSRDQGCCSVNFIKFVLYFFNFIFFLSGVAVFGFGIWTLVSKHEFVSLLTTNTYVVTTYLLVAAGALVFVVFIIGCLGLLREDRCLLLIYTFLLLLIFLLEAVSGVLAYVYEEQVYGELADNLNKTFIDNYDVDTDLTKTIDLMQTTMKCCGAVRFEDWRYSKWKKHLDPRHRENKVPDSCCRTYSVDCGRRDHPSNIYYTGCIHMMEYIINDHLILLGAVGLGICVLQIFGMIFSCCLYIKLKDFDD